MSALYLTGCLLLGCAGLLAVLLAIEAGIAWYQALKLLTGWTDKIALKSTGEIVEIPRSIRRSRSRPAPPDPCPTTTSRTRIINLHQHEGKLT